jgi:kumamolisin
MRSVNRWIARGAVIGAAAVISLPLAIGSASASGPGPNTQAGTGTQAPVTGGISASAVPGASLTGTTPATTPETVSIVLKAQHLNQLEDSVVHGVSSYLSTAQFADTYGQTSTYLSNLQRYLARYTITTSVYADDLDVKAMGTAGDFDRAFAVQQRDYHVPAQHGRNGLQGEWGTPAENVHSPTSAPQVPKKLAKNIEAILGLSNYSAFVSQSVRAGGAKTAQTSTTACAAEANGPPDGCNTPADFAYQYDLQPVYAKAAEGQGQTIGIVTLAALNQTAPQTFWHTVLQIQTGPRTVTVDTVDGGPGAPTVGAGSGETDLDTEQSGALAPDANIVVYQAPNTTAGFVDAFFTAATDNVADSVSASWGESETAIEATVAKGKASPGYAAAFSEAFLEMAAQGQSAFTSSADEGAYTASRDIGTTNLSVDNPADSPYITAAGGTTLPWSGTFTGTVGGKTKVAHVKVKAQRTWGWDYLWPAISKVTGIPYATVAKREVIGSGGGYSLLFTKPSYQMGVPGVYDFHAVQYLTPTDPQQVAPGLVEPVTWTVNPSPSVTRGNSLGRALPDVSADADPYSGYLLYGPNTTNVVTLQGGWGGTSFVAPQLNGSTAVIDSMLGHRVGFWNPAMYALATSSRSPFTPLDQSGTSNDNIYYTGNPGTVYNPGSGLGTPNLSELATDFGSSHS